MEAVPHLGFIIAAYSVAAVALLGMIGAVWFDYRSLSAQLKTLEQDRRDKTNGLS